MTYRIIVPPGIGDFSWIWSKLSTTGDQYFIEYADTGPDRLGPFLKLLPKDKIAGWEKSKRYKVGFDTEKLEMMLMPAVERLERYEQLKENPDKTFYVEANTHLERGNRIEEWLPNLKTDLHYEIERARPIVPLSYPAKKAFNIFIVHLSSCKMQRIWQCYDMDKCIRMVKMIQNKKGWIPVFIGAEYDDFAMDCCKEYSKENNAINLIGKTSDVLDALAFICLSKLFLGLVSSGMTMLANVLCVPSISWWPRPGLPPSWPDMEIPYLWFLWNDFEEDYKKVESWIGDS